MEVAAIPLDQHVAVVLHHLEGSTFAEIGDLVGIPARRDRGEPRVASGRNRSRCVVDRIRLTRVYASNKTLHTRTVARGQWRSALSVVKQP